MRPNEPVHPHESSGYYQIFESSPFAGVVSRLEDDTVIAINRRTAQIVGVTIDEAPGQLVTDYYADPAERRMITEQLRRDGSMDARRVQIRRRDGEPMWLLASSA